LLAVVVLYGFILATLVHMSLIFPKRHPLLLRRPDWVLWIYLGVWLPMLLYLAVRWTAIVSPAGRLALVVQGTTLMSAVYFPLLLLSTYSSYRTGSAREKRQLRWLMWGLVISLVPYLVFTVLPSLLGLNFHLTNPPLGLLWCTVPTSFAIAVLRERLFDIDVIIRRTLIYTVLTVTLGVIYFF
jgi:two-component system NarL family sensor kinase